MPSCLIPRACVVLALALWSTPAAAQDPDRDFSGVWLLDEQQSNVRALPSFPASVLNITQQAAVMQCLETDQAGQSAHTWTYRTDGEPAKFQIGESRMNSLTKWEGAALITNTIVSGPQSYSINDRWRLSRDGNTLTIRRQIQRGSSESEALLVYRNRDAKEAAPSPSPQAKPSAPNAPPGDVVVPSGTKIPLALINSLNTKHAAEGDRVYLQTSFPITIGGRIIIPRGSYVTGTVTEVKRPGKLKGKGEIYLRFDSLTLPNGVTRNFRARLGGADADVGQLDREEGKIRGEGNKSGDARRVGETTAAGAGVGSIAGAAAGHAGMGAGIGAAAGAAAGLASVLLSRGPDLILPKGTSFEMVLDRDVRYRGSELH